MAYPTKYQPELVGQFLDLVAEGMTVSQACRVDGMPARRTVTLWAREHVDFARKLHQAREEGAFAMAEESLEIADTDPDPQRARNRIEVRRWYAGCIRPRTFGPRAHLDVTVEDRTDLGALQKEAWARVVDMSREAQLRGHCPAGLIVDAEVIPEPAVGVEVDPFG